MRLLPRTKKILTAAAAWAAIFFAVIWVKVQVVRSGYRLQETENRLKAVQLELSELEFQLGQAVSAARVREKAHQLGFELPGQYDLNRIRYPEKPADSGGRP